MPDDGPVLQLGRPRQQQQEESQNVISADASCVAWIQSKLELVRLLHYALGGTKEAVAALVLQIAIRGFDRVFASHPACYCKTHTSLHPHSSFHQRDLSCARTSRTPSNGCSPCGSLRRTQTLHPSS